MFKKYISVILSAVLLFCSVITAFALDNGEIAETLNVGGHNLVVGDLLYENNFDNDTLGTLPDGWSAGYSRGTGVNKTSFGWSRTDETPTLSTKVVEYSQYGKVLELKTSGTDAYMALPSVNTLNYVYEANVIVNYNAGSLGLANNFYDSTDKSSGAMFTIFYPNSTNASIFRYSNGGSQGTWDKSFSPKAGDKLKLKIVSFEGYNYIFYNDEHVATAPWRTVEDGTYSKDNPGFYSCNGQFYITDVKVNSVFANDLSLKAMRTVIKSDKTAAIESEFSYDKTQELYGQYCDGNYTYAKNNSFVLGAIIHLGDADISDTLTANTNGAVIKEFDNNLITQNSQEINIKYSLDITADDFEKIVTIRPFTRINGQYFFSKGKAYSAVALANGAYVSAENDTQKALIEEAFNGYEGFNPSVAIWDCDKYGHYEKKVVSGLFYHLECVADGCDYVSANYTAGLEVSVETVEINNNIYVSGGVFYENNFDNETVNTLPDGWSAAYPAGTGNNHLSFGWGNANGTITAKVVQNATYGKVLQLASSGTDGYMALPKIDSMNYIYEAKIIVNSSAGSFGLANNYYAPVYETSGAAYSAVYPNSTTASQYRYRQTGPATVNWTTSYNPALGEEITLKVVCLNGNNFIYYNDDLVATGPLRPDANILAPTFDYVGFYVCGGNILVREVKVTEILTANNELDAMRVVIENNSSLNIETEFSFDKSQEIFSYYNDVDYVYNKDGIFTLGNVISIGDADISNSLTVKTSGAQVIPFNNASITQDKNFVHAKAVKKISADDTEKIISVRPYTYINGVYLYGEGKAYSVVALANGAYVSEKDEAKKAIIADMFSEFEEFQFSSSSSSLTFTVFADFHYKEGMYSTNIADMRQILNRADETNSSFILSCGDMCNDYKGSPELINTLYNYTTTEGEILLAYNVYGNHELEVGNSMQDVTPTLTNDNAAIWGDGTVGNDPNNLNIAYYYFEENGFRFICLDNNYSWNPNHINGKEVGWEHYLTGSWGAPSAADNAKRNFDEGANAVANTKGGSLGATQLAWLESVLMDAAKKDIPCIIVGHAGYSGLGFGGGADDAAQVRELYKKANDANSGTVLISMNGHEHTDNYGWRDGVLYLDINTVRNNLWQNTSEHHYGDEHTFSFEEYDSEGNLIRVTEKPLNTLSMGKQTWFSADPLSCVITVTKAGSVIVDGAESEWIYDIVPAGASEAKGQHCAITSGIYWDCDKYGHFEEKVIDGEYYQVKCLASGCDYTSAKYSLGLNGDCNNDGEVNTVDLAAMKLYLADLGDISANNADINKDGKIDTVDLAELKLHLAGL